MAWIDNNGEVRPQSWEEHCEIEARSRCLPYWMMGAGFNYRPQPLHPSRIKTENREKVLRIRQRLFRADSHCFWCGQLTKYGAVGDPLQSTVDHLYSRMHPKRADRYREQKGVLHVLACAECNNERGVCEQQQRPFVPKLRERLSFAQRADATLAKRSSQHVTSESSTRLTTQPMRVIQTFEEAVEFAREHPGR